MSANRSPAPRLRPLPYVLLGAMTLASFGGPFAMLAVIRGGQSARWPPDRPVEWITIGVVVALVVALFCACVSIGAWYSGGWPAPARPSSGDPKIQPEPGIAVSDATSDEAPVESRQR